MLIDRSLGSAIGQPSVHGSMHQSQMNVLLHWERLPPLAIKVAAEIAGVSIELKADPKFGKDSLPLLLLQSSRCVICLMQPRASVIAKSIVSHTGHACLQTRKTSVQGRAGRRSISPTVHC